MFYSQKESDRDKNYQILVKSARAFTEGENDLIALLANISSLIKVYVDDLNWAGFYLLRGKELVLGPFQGLPACTRIGEGKGVCGRAVLEGKPLVVDDVRLFPGHIACDTNSVSELVIPVYRGGAIFGVLDLDSPLPKRFAESELAYLGQLAEIVSAFLDTLPWKQ